MRLASSCSGGINGRGLVDRPRPGEPWRAADGMQAAVKGCARESMGWMLGSRACSCPWVWVAGAARGGFWCWESVWERELRRASMLFAEWSSPGASS